MKNISIFMGLALLGTTAPVLTQGQDGPQPLLTVKEIMNGIITPTTSTIWGAYQLQSETEWLEVQNAALAVIGAGNLLALGGAADGEQNAAQESDWITYNSQMIEAARAVITAVDARDEEALSEAGNNALYPPCESCHQQYQ
ncbi:MAG: hypothetical protein GKR91_03855 [Pseudomonadales bacterium]|nr:hypothetical protein [Pseudomonadales bacterium]